MSEFPEVVYKVLRQDEHDVLERFGRFTGSPDDERDGFIHLSTRELLPGTLAKHFAGEEGLIIVALAVSEMADALQWEPSRGGVLFPHLYGAILPSMLRGKLSPAELDSGGVQADSGQDEALGETPPE